MKRHPKLLFSTLWIALAISAFSAARVRADIPALPTASTAIVGYFSKGPTDLALPVTEAQFISTFGSSDPAAWPAELQARRFFEHGGSSLITVRVAHDKPLLGRAPNLSGLHAAKVFDFRLLLIPEITRLPDAQLPDALTELKSFADEENLFVILDPPDGWDTAAQAVSWVEDNIPTDASGMAIYWPYLRSDFEGSSIRAGASGAMAALYAQNDAANEIWDSPAGRNLPLIASAIEPDIGDTETTTLNLAGICSIRDFTGIGIIPWGARTLDPNDNEQRYIATARTLRWIDASIDTGMAFAASADNNPTTWNQISSDAQEFFSGLYLRGAFAGSRPSEAFYLAIGEGVTMSAQDIAEGIAILDIGLAFVRPAEFVISRHRIKTYDASTPIPRPAITLHQHAGRAYLSFPTVAGFTYEFQSSADLATYSVGTPLPGDGNWLGTNVPQVAPRKFYRVKVRSAR